MDERKDETVRYATFDALLTKLLTEEAGGDVAKALEMVDEYVAKMVAGSAEYKQKWGDKLRRALQKLETDLS